MRVYVKVNALGIITGASLDEGVQSATLLLPLREGDRLMTVEGPVLLFSHIDHPNQAYKPALILCANSGNQEVNK